MKKLIATLAIAAIALTSTFAVDSTLSFDGSSQSAPEMNVTLKSSLTATPYDLSLTYGSEKGTISFTDGKVIDGLDLTVNGNTEEFNVLISSGNLNKTITFVTEISALPFTGLVDGKEYTTENNLSIVNSKGDSQSAYKAEIAAGPNASQSIAQFNFKWDGQKDLPAGDYETTNKISISVN